MNKSCGFAEGREGGEGEKVFGLSSRPSRDPKAGDGLVSSGASCKSCPKIILKILLLAAVLVCSVTVRAANTGCGFDANTLSFPGTPLEQAHRTYSQPRHRDPQNFDPAFWGNRLEQLLKVLQ